MAGNARLLFTLVMFPVFTLFGRQIGTYGICAVIGLLVCGFVLSAIGKRRNISFPDIILSMLAAGIGLFIGGHLLYGITQYRLAIYAFEQIGAVSFVQFIMLLGAAFGGSVFYGGFLGGLAGLLIFLRIGKSLNRRVLLDLYGLATPLFHTFGRIGCFLGGCCYGVESSFGFTVSHNDFSPGLAGVRRFPNQLLEALLNLILFFVLYLACRRISRKGPGSDIPGILSGIVFFLYMSVYPIYRFILEFFRGDTIRGFLGPLSTSQWISIPVFLAGIIGTCIILRRRKKA